MKKQCIFTVLLWSAGCGAVELVPWTWSLHKTFKHKPTQRNKKHVVFAYTDMKPFTQMLFSWNAERPKEGYYRFWAQIRNAATKKWHAWHKMIDWGYQVQRSYYENGSKDETTYAHVRLEAPHSSYADGVRFVVTPVGGAEVQQIQSINLSLSNMKGFTSEVGSKKFESLSSVFIKNVPLQSQMTLDHPKKEILCSPTSCSMVLSYLLKKPIQPELFAEGSFDAGLNFYGSWPFNTAHAYELSKGLFHFHVTRLHSFIQLYKKLKENMPVVVSVRGVLKGAPKEYTNGHLLVVIGYDQHSKKVIVHDPAIADNHEVLKSYELSSFLRAWERSRRLAYVAERV